MSLRLLFISFLALALGGCATTQNSATMDQLQSRVTDLEKKSEAKDAEIVDLQYQVKDLSSKVDSSDNSESSQPAPEPAQATTPTDVAPETSDVIRVQVGAEKVQRALRAAGVYTGKIDGKIGAGTKDAIVEFQKGHGLKADGIVGARTWQALKKYLR